MAVKWTEEAIRAEAAKYSSKAAFKLGNQSAYTAARTRFPGLLDELFENQYRYWDESALRAEAAKYSSKKEFARGNNGAYGATRTRFPGLLDELFGKNVSWDEAAVRAEAAKYSSKAEFRRDSASAYNAALRLGMIDVLFENQRRYWDEGALRAEAAKYSSKVEFELGKGSAYTTARTRFPGLLDEMFGKSVSWDEAAIRAEAAKFGSKVEFQRGNGSAYGAALTRFPGLLDELFENQYCYTDADAFYIWRVEGQWFKGHPVFKVGITSARLGFERIRICTHKNRVRATDIHLFKTEHAKLIEKGFHDALELVPDLDLTDGKTEFRSCDEATLRGLINFATMLGDRYYEEEELLAA